MKRFVWLWIALVLMTQTVIVQASPNSTLGFQAFGAGREFWRYQGPEVILSGPYETGKTITSLTKLHCLLCKYPNAQALMVRQTYASLISSAVVTYEKKVLPYPPGDPRCAVTKYGGERPELYTYPNGSRIVLAGMDHPEKVLSAEFDYIYVNQAEETALNVWEQLTGRATGRAGNVPYPQVMGDCNPGAPTHWILHRPRLKVFSSRHEDNPTLYDQQTGQLTERGKRTMETLDALTGVRYKRGRLGKWAGVEGQVYEEWDDNTHLLDPAKFNRAAIKRTIASVDWGYTNPGVIQVWAIDGDARMYLPREIYRTGKLIEWWVEQAKALRDEFHISVFVCDPAEPAYIEQFKRAGLNAIAANNSISLGIQAVQSRLKVAADGKPRLFMLSDALVEPDPQLVDKHLPLSAHDEILMYVWPTAPDGKPVKEVPVDLYNHGMDTKRYAVMHVDHNTEAAIYVGSRRVG